MLEKMDKDLAVVRKFVLQQMNEAENFCMEHREKKDRQYWVCKGAVMELQRILDVVEKLYSLEEIKGKYKVMNTFLLRKYDMEL